MNSSEEAPRRPPLPEWIRVKVHRGSNRAAIDAMVKSLHLHTVCTEARCPNLAECFHHRTATFLILGGQCTRNCRFCAVSHEARPALPDPGEPERLADAVRRMNLRYAVITSVTRDDLPDGGASVFADCIRAVHKVDEKIEVEVLTPDFLGSREALKTVLDAGPAVFNHNLETVERMASQVRSAATYRRTLEVLRAARELSGGCVPTKSGLMVGLGETDEEILEAFRDLRSAGVSLLTVGQYLPPSGAHWPLARYVTPDTFEMYRREALNMGFEGVACGALVRSSYHAAELRQNVARA